MPTALAGFIKQIIVENSDSHSLHSLGGNTTVHNSLI